MLRHHLSSRFSQLLAGALLAALSGACGSDSAIAGPNAVLITLDTTRADALGVYGGPAGLTPHLDALAAESVVFMQARTVTPQTLPSHSSMLTGLYPPRHTVRVNNLQLPSSAETLAERAQARGVQTAAFVASVALEGGTGIAQGFDVFDQPQAPAYQDTHQYDDRSGDTVTEAALSWLRTRDTERPFFLWAHYFDPHFPYKPKADFAARAPKSAYHGEVAAMDAYVGRLVEGLRAEGLLERTTILVVADHGEGLGEHGERSHGEFLWDSTMRVPLFVRWPGGRDGGERNEALVSVVDVFPTLLRTLELGSPPRVDGIDLDSADQGTPRGVYFEALNGSLNFGWSPLVGWMNEEGKYLHSSDPQFFDPRNDPRELNVLEADNNRFLGELARVLSLPSLPADDRSNVDPDRVEELQRLGYSAGGERFVGEIDPLAPTDRPAPHQRIDELESFNQTRLDIELGRKEEGLASLEKIVADNPFHASALYELGQIYRLGDRPEDAIRVLERAIALGSEWYAPHANLGIAYFQIAQRDQSGEHLAQAERHLRRALELHPKLEPVLGLLVRILEMTGRQAETPPFRERIKALRGG